MTYGAWGLIALTACIYLLYFNAFGVTVADGWSMVSYVIQIQQGDLDSVMGFVAGKRPLEPVYYFANSFFIDLFGIPGIQIHVFTHILLCASLVFLYFSRKLCLITATYIALLFLLYPSAKLSLPPRPLILFLLNPYPSTPPWEES